MSTSAPKQNELTLGFSPWGTGTSECDPFDDIFTYTKDCKKDGFDGIDAFILWGGTDIHPSFYRAQPHRMNGAPIFPSERDLWEWKAMQYCKAHGIPIIGICRGAQFLCAFAGGQLIQHVSGHGGPHHEVVTNDGEVFLTNSYHHQMLDVWGTNHKLIAWSKKAQSNEYYGERSETPDHIKEQIAKGTWKEPEIVFFPEVKGLAIQGHPEWAGPELKEFRDISVKLVLDYLLVRKVFK